MSLQLAHSDVIGNPVARYMLDTLLRPINANLLTRRASTANQICRGIIVYIQMIGRMSAPFKDATKVSSNAVL